MKICYVAIAKSLSEGYFGRDLWIVCKGFVGPPSRHAGQILPPCQMINDKSDLFGFQGVKVYTRLS